MSGSTKVVLGHTYVECTCIILLYSTQLYKVNNKINPHILTPDAHCRCADIVHE